MFALIVQTVLLFAIAFILGCVIGSLLHHFFGSKVNTPDTDLKVKRSSDESDRPLQPTVAETVTPPERAPVIPPPPIAARETVDADTGAEASKRTAATSAPPLVPGQNASKPTAAKDGIPEIQTVDQASGAADNLKLIRGIGPQNEGRLNALGITRFDQIAAWTKKDQREFGDALSFPGRIEREEWVSQARKLAQGKATPFSERVVSGSVTTSVSAALVGSPGTKPKTLLDAPLDGRKDNLTLIDGVGTAIEKKLYKLGVFHFQQIADMDAEGLRWLGTAVGFPGRAERENWQGEAKVLAANGTTKHADRVQRGQIRTSRKS